MSSLELRNVTKRFGAVKALNSLSLSVNDGEFLVLLGPTGAGKTTTLRCVAGLEKLDGGDVVMDGQVLGKTSPAERDVALVFQSYALYPRKTVFQNMAFPLQARKLPPDQIEKTVCEVARKLNIEPLLERKPAQLSGGQQQRVALGRAMVRHPRLFLMDEPLTNLDFKLRVEMRTELKRLQRDLSATFFYVTNDQVEAMSMADRIAVLNHGLLQQLDTPEQIYSHPKSLFVAGFVGSPRMNFLNCVYDAASGVAAAADVWHVDLTPAQRETVGRRHVDVLGIRAENIHLLHEAQPDSFPVEVFVVEPLGDRLLVDVHLGKDTMKVKVAPDFPVSPGDRLWCKFDPDRFHLFDKESGVAAF
jgi:multiple sugar transport system ATP-binding protein